MEYIQVLLDGIESEDAGAWEALDALEQQLTAIRLGLHEGELGLDARRAGRDTLQPRTRTLWSSEHGPIFTSILGLPLFPWNPATAYALHDGEADHSDGIFGTRDRAASIS